MFGICPFAGGPPASSAAVGAGVRQHVVGLAPVVDLVLEEVGEAAPERQAEVLPGLHRVEREGSVELGRIERVAETDVPLVVRRVGVAEGVEVLEEELVEAGEGGGLLLQALAMDEVGAEDVVHGAVDGAKEPAPVPDELFVGQTGARRVEAPVGPGVVSGGGGKVDQHAQPSRRAKSPQRTTSYSAPTGRPPSAYIGADLSVISRMASLSTNRR